MEALIGMSCNENICHWNDLGFWQWSCGCVRFGRDSEEVEWERCKKHAGKLVPSDPAIQGQVVDNPVVYSGEQLNARVGLPTDPKERKNTPIWSGVVCYFPLALAAVAKVSKVGNDQHNPGEPLRWAREKSTDQLDCLMRHLIDHKINPIDTDGTRHLAKAVWRGLAELELCLEKELEHAV